MVDVFLTDKDKRQLEAGINSKAEKGHKHTAEDIGNGVMDIAHGGTGGKTAAEALEKLGGLPYSEGVKIETGTYDGDFVDAQVTKTLNFIRKPYLVFIFDGVNGGYYFGIFSRTATSGRTNHTTAPPVPATWGEKSLTITASRIEHLCTAGVSYNYIAFCI